MADQAHDVSENRHGFVFKVGPELVAVQREQCFFAFLLNDSDHLGRKCN